MILFLLLILYCHDAHTYTQEYTDSKQFLFFFPPSQELSNTIWAFATSGVRGNTQVQLVKFIADALDDGDGQFFGADFKRTFLLTFLFRSLVQFIY